MKNFPQRLLLSNRAWVANRLALRTQYFEHLAKEQNPAALWIGCSDSRVPAEEITGCRPGELFVHRNIANVIVPADVGLQSILYYSLIVLKVPHVIVCGHTGCGGIRAAMCGVDQPALKSWLDPVTQMIPDHARGNSSGLDIDAPTFDSLVRKNVRRGIETLNAHPIVQDAWKSGSLHSLRGWVYGLESGIIEPVMEMVGGTEIDTSSATLEDIQLLQV